MYIMAMLLITAPLVMGASLQWWQTAIVYQIYPRSFQDSDGDGVGDLKGIQSRLDYFEYLGVEVIWLSPIFESPMKDFGYDISNHTKIDQIFGTMEHFDDLIEDIHQRGMKLILDYVPNHTSDLHPWFLASKKGGVDNPYLDYYVFNKGILLLDGTRAPPNNWLSIFGGSAWEWVEERQEYYYHMFVKEQPDLNYRNPSVRQDMKDVFRFWIEKGVDGFRIDAVNTLFENNYDIDEVLLSEDLPKDEYLSYSHPNREHQAQIHDVTREWRKVFNEYKEKTGKEIFMVMEVYDKTMTENMKYYYSGSDMPFNFNLIFTTADCGGTCIHKLVDSWMSNMPQGKWPNFVLGNHDQRRITTRKGEKYADAMNMLLLTLPGTPTTYQGEEIAMRDVWVSYQDTVDPWGVNFGPERYEKHSRDPCRSPMQWNAGTNAGFSTATKTWLPVGEDYKTRNVEAQRNDPESSLMLYKSAAALRRRPAFQNNKLHYGLINENIFSYTRTDGTDSYLIAINVGDRASTDDYTKYVDRQSGNVVLKTANVKLQGAVNLQDITIYPGDGVVIQLIKTKEEL